MVDDTELDNFVQDDLMKDLNQSESIDPSVEIHLQEMGWLWKSTNDKIQEDNTCFKCKGQLRVDDKDLENKSFILRASGTEKGVVAFISLCSRCQNEEIIKHNKSIDKDIKDEVK